MASSSLWQRFQRYFLEYRDLDFSLDISRMKFPEDLFEKMQPRTEQAFAAMRELEAGAIANPTENRMVGHYWLRNPALAPTPEIRSEIEDTIRRVKAFAEDVHAGKITAENGTRFKHMLHIGIGGSALGPQFVSAALGSPDDPMDIFFFDNTDPEGFDRVFDRIGEGLPQMSQKNWGRRRGVVAHMNAGRLSLYSRTRQCPDAQFRPPGSFLCLTIPSRVAGGIW